MAFVMEGSNFLEQLYSPTLWADMWWYGPLFVVIFQITYRSSTKLNSSGLLSMGLASVFVLNMIWATIIVQQYPTTSQYIGGAIILISIISSLVERSHRKKEWEVRGGGGGGGGGEGGTVHHYYHHHHYL